MRLYQNLIDRFARTGIGGWTFLHVFNPLDKRLMRWSNGLVSTGLGTDFRDNAVLLICTGARSGKTREIPLLSAPLDDGWVLIASATGQKHNPAWYHNLRAHPDCELLVPRRGRLRCKARELEGEERERAWAAANAQYDGYTDYQARTERRIPVMLLTPVAG